MSDDEGTKPKGGDLGFFGHGQMVKPFDEAAWGAQIGALVGPVKTDFGYHLIQVLDKQAGGVQPFEQVQAALRARLISERVPQVAEGRAKEAARKIADQKIKTAEELKAFADKEGLAFETTPPFGRDDAPAGIGRAADFNTAAFEKLSGDQLSEPIKIGRGWAIAAPSEGQHAAHAGALRGAPKGALVEVLEAKKQRAAAKARLDGIRGQIAAGQKDLATAAKELGVEVKESESITRTANIEGVGSAQKVVEAALEMPVGALSQAIETGERRHALRGDGAQPLREGHLRGREVEDPQEPRRRSGSASSPPRCSSSAAATSPRRSTPSWSRSSASRRTPPAAAAEPAKARRQRQGGGYDRRPFS